MTIKQEVILIKQGFPHPAFSTVSRKACMHSISFSVSLQDLFVIHLSASESFCLEKTNKLNNVHISNQITYGCNKTESQTHWTIQRCFFSGRWMSVWWWLFGCCRLCGQPRDDVCTPAMAPGEQSHSWSRKGEDGSDGMVVRKRGTGGEWGRRLEGHSWGGRGREAKELESCIHY